GQAVALAEVLAVAARVLRDEHDLLDAAGEQLARLGDDALERLRAVLALDQRDRAEGAGVIAAVRDLEVGARAAGRAGWLGRQLLGADPGRADARPDRLEQARQLRPAHRPERAVEARHRGRQAVAPALGQAAGRDQLLAAPLAARQRAERVERLLLGRLDEATGVDDQGGRLRRVVDL